MVTLYQPPQLCRHGPLTSSWLNSDIHERFPFLHTQFILHASYHSYNSSFMYRTILTIHPSCIVPFLQFILHASYHSSFMHHTILTSISICHSLQIVMGLCLWDVVYACGCGYNSWHLVQVLKGRGEGNYFIICHMIRGTFPVSWYYAWLYRLTPAVLS